MNVPLTDLLEEDRQKRTQALEEIRKSEEYLKSCLLSISRTEQGRFFLWYLFGLCGVFESTFTGDRKGDLLEGARAVGCHVLTRLMDVNPDCFTEMIKTGK